MYCINLPVGVKACQPCSKPKGLAQKHIARWVKAITTNMGVCVRGRPRECFCLVEAYY